MDIYVQLLKVIIPGVINALNDSHCKRSISAEIMAAKDIASNMNYEADTIHTIMRILTHLESAYYLSLASNVKIRRRWSNSFDAKINTLCYHIALCHKYIDSSQALISDWIMVKTIPNGGYHLLDTKEVDLLITPRDKEQLISINDKLHEEFLRASDNAHDLMTMLF